MKMPAMEQPGAIPPEGCAAGAAGGGLAAPGPRETLAGSNRNGMTTASLGNVDFGDFTRVGGGRPLDRIKIATGAGVCLHRGSDGFDVEIHAHDGDGGYLISMSQAEAERIGRRLLMFAALKPGQPPQAGRNNVPAGEK